MEWKNVIQLNTLNSHFKNKKFTLDSCLTLKSFNSDTWLFLSWFLTLIERQCGHHNVCPLESKVSHKNFPPFLHHLSFSLDSLTFFVYPEKKSCYTTTICLFLFLFFFPCLLFILYFIIWSASFQTFLVCRVRFHG